MIGILAWLALGHWLTGPLRMVVAGDGFFLVYLVITAVFMTRLTPEGMRKRADFEDEGIVVIVCLTIAAISLSLGAIFLLLNQQLRPAQIAMSLCGVPLGWLTFHTVMASHYGHLFYQAAERGSKTRSDAGGLAFPGTKEPGSWDFLYYSFVVGMTAQVSDVQVEATHLRRMTLGHGIVSFFYNTVLLALAVNVAISH